MDKIKKKNTKFVLKPNPVDILAGLIIILFLLVINLGFIYKKEDAGRLVTLTIEIFDQNQINLIQKEAENLGDVYVNSVNNPVKTVEAAKKNDKFEIKIIGKGEISQGKYIFNGQRILVGQKAEIHGSYFAQGYIKDVKYTD